VTRQPGDPARVAVVTNATAYAGPGAVNALLKAGYTVVCHDPSFIDGQRRTEFENGHHGAVASEHQSPERAVTRAIRLHDRIDVLVSNDVHPLQHIPVEQCEASDIRAAAEALLIGPVALVAKAAGRMRRQGSGRIIMITSAAPAKPEPGFSVYSCARAGASAFAQAAGRELAPHGITVNAIAPNFLESEQYYPDALWRTEAGADRLAQLVPAGRLGTGPEIGELVVFLAGDAAAFITGEVIRFTGGWP
jgi:NAD(P)-dependent dehydrogenase (short-subunit alcohol dehydrogenase family)